MKSFLAALAVSVAALGAASQADAATFEFSFSNVSGPVSGDVFGELVLADGDGTHAATSLIVTSAPAVLGYSTPFDVLANFTTVLENNFSVVGGEIDIFGSQFAAFVYTMAPTNGSSFGLAAGSYTTSMNMEGSLTPYTGVHDADSFTLNFTAVPTATVPLPATLALSLLGLGALGIGSRAGRRRAA